VRKEADPRELAMTILTRSICAVMVGAVITDWRGRVISWGWNSVGSGFGLHAEAHAMSRVNRRRLSCGTIYVAAIRHRTGRPVTAKPCPECQRLIDKYDLDVVYRDGYGAWRTT
jgi:deoxycytidylate deaminase